MPLNLKSNDFSCLVRFWCRAGGFRPFQIEACVRLDKRPVQFCTNEAQRGSLNRVLKYLCPWRDLGGSLQL